MKRIFKYPLHINGLIAVRMPAGAQLLTVAVQGDQVCLWAMVDDAAPTVRRQINIYGTGHPADDAGSYVSTFQMHGGSLVFHVFDAGEVSA